MRSYVPEWPKWVTARCPKCGTVVPRGDEHVCPAVLGDAGLNAPAERPFGHEHVGDYSDIIFSKEESTPAEPSGLTQANAEAQVLVDCLNEALKDTDRLDGRQISIRGVHYIGIDLRESIDRALAEGLPCPQNLVPTDRERARENLQSAVEVDEAREQMQRDTQRLITLWRRHYHDKPLEGIREDIDAEQVSRSGEQCNCAYHAHPAQSPCGVMTMEQAMEMAKCYACLGLDALTSLGPADLAAEFIRIDCAARIKTLEWVRDHVLINDRADDGPMHVAIERRLKEIKDAG